MWLLNQRRQVRLGSDYPPYRLREMSDEDYKSLIDVCLAVEKRSRRVHLSLDLNGVHPVDARNQVHYLVCNALRVCPVTVDSGLMAGSQFGRVLSERVPQGIAEMEYEVITLRRGIYYVCWCGKHRQPEPLHFICRISCYVTVLGTSYQISN